MALTFPTHTKINPALKKISAKYLLLFLICPAGFFAQNVTVKGKAHPSYKNKLIQLYSLTDFITNIKQKEAQDTIESDGFFELSFHTDYTQPVFLKIDNVTAKLYIQPDFVYGITRDR